MRRKFLAEKGCVCVLPFKEEDFSGIFVFQAHTFNMGLEECSYSNLAMCGLGDATSCSSEALLFVSRSSMTGHQATCNIE